MSRTVANASLVHRPQLDQSAPGATPAGAAPAPDAAQEPGKVKAEPARPALSWDFSHVPLRSRVQPLAAAIAVAGATDAADEREADAAARRMAGGGPQPGARDAEPAVAATPGSVASVTSIMSVLAQPGEPLAAAQRAYFEPRFGHDFSAVRVHRGASAASSARDVAAEAYTVGTRVVFGSGRYAPETQAGRALLAHELAHVVQQSRRSQGLRLQRKPLPRNRAPFAKVEALNAQAATALADFLSSLTALPGPGPTLQRQIEAIDALSQRMNQERDGSRRVIDSWVAREEIPVTVPIDAANYVLDDKPSPRGLAMVEQRDANLLSLVDLVRPRVTRLAAIAGTLGADTPDELRAAFETVAGYYLDTLPLAGNRRIFEQLRFLDTYYRDPRVIQGYGLWAYIRPRLPELYENVLRSMPGSEYTFVVSSSLKSQDPRFTPQEIGDLSAKGQRGKKGGETASVINQLRDLKQFEEAVGELPSKLSDVRRQWDPDSNAKLVRLFIDLQVRVSVLHLWQAIQPLQELLYGTANAGQSLIPFSADDRQQWLEELNKLQNEFVDELKLGDHPGVEGRIDNWIARLEPLTKAIPAEVRLKKIIAAIVEQLPFMFVAGATAAKIGLWVRAATQSKWLVALAEGSTLTLFNVAAMPAGSPQRPTSAAGWAANLAINVLLSRVGRLFGDIGASLAKGRSAVIAFSAQVAAPTIAMTGLQTGVQLIEAKIKASGGETSLTELLTINLVMSGIGVVVGAATTPERMAGGAAPAGSGGAPLARLGPTELARQLGIPEDQARLLLEFADKLTDFKSAVDAVNSAAAKGALDPKTFDALRQQGLDLADFLDARCEPLAKAGAFGDTTPAQVKAGIASMRAKLSAMDYASLLRVRALLPESTTGLVRFGTDEQWVYDRDSPPAGLKALRDDYTKRGQTVKALPSGGFEARDPATGALLAQIVPMNSNALQAMGKSVADLAKGPLAQQGLAKARMQSAIRPDLLEAQLEVAGATPAGAAAVPRVLQHLARFVAADNAQAWAGLSNYLANGGDPTLLARGMAYGSPKEFAAESKALANSLLEQMADWDGEAVDGFAQLYALKPRLTAERLHSLISMPAAQVQGILQSLSVLAPRSKGLGAVIGPLTSGAVTSERGAIGALTSGVQLAEQHPNATLVFEAPVTDQGGGIVRVIDISVQETQTTRVAGVDRTTTVEVAAVEVKEVSTASLGKRAPQELARDIQRDSKARAQRVTPVAGSRPFFETFKWRIRGIELRQLAIDSLANPAATEAQMDAKMRDLIQTQLTKAFDRPEFKALPAAEQDGYRAAFAGLPFVEFF